MPLIIKDDGHYGIRQHTMIDPRVFACRFKPFETADPTKLIVNDPATIVYYGDKRYVAKCGDEDDYNPLFGIMACALRKVGRNHITIDLWEPVIEFLADYLADAEDCRVVAEMLQQTAEILELDGAMEQIEEYDARNDPEWFRDGDDAL